jgi:hypothetical protein
LIWNGAFIFVFFQKQEMEKAFFRILAKINKIILPSFTKKRLDLTKASKLQLALIGWRYYVTTKALD